MGNHTNYARPTGRRPAYNPNPFGPNATLGESRGVKTTADVFTNDLKKTIEHSLDRLGADVKAIEVGQKSHGGKKICRLVLQVAEELAWSEIHHLQAAIRHAWNSVSPEGRKSLGYSVTINGTEVSRCW